MLDYRGLRSLGNRRGRSTKQRAQARAQLQISRLRPAVELQIPRDDHLACPKRPQALRVGLGLRTDRGQRRKGAFREARQPCVAARGPLRHPRIHQVQRDAGGAAGVDQIGPQLRFHQDAEPRAEVAQEARRTPRHIVGHVAAQDTAAEELLARLASGGGHVGEQDLVVRVRCLQGFHQRLGCPRLADRHGMQPDQGVSRPPSVEAEALAHIAQVGGLLAGPPHQPQKNQRGGKRQQQRVQQPHEPSTSRSAAITSPTDGGLPTVPTLRARGAP